MIHIYIIERYLSNLKIHSVLSEIIEILAQPFIKSSNIKASLQTNEVNDLMVQLVKLNLAHIKSVKDL